MNQADAYKYLSVELNTWLAKPFDELERSVGQTHSNRCRAEDAAEYVVEISVDWYSREEGALLVSGMAALASCGPLHRMDRSFVVTQNGIRSA